MNLYLATGNAHKVTELAAMLADVPTIRVQPLAAFGGMIPVEETGTTFAANAHLKASAVRAILPQDALVLADDSGLAVDALGGQPGVCSARYAGEGATDACNNAKLLDALQAIPPEQRTARFICALCLLGPQIDETFAGACAGRIASEPFGTEGFGYDPLFIPDGFTETFGQLGATVKASLSHRGHALQQLKQWLQAQSR